MGTTYTMKVYVDSWRTQNSIESELNKLFSSFNKTFSTWDESSEISAFNKSSSTNYIDISNDLTKVLDLSKSIYELSRGAFDPTVKPLLDLWGFSKNNIYFEIPDENLIKSTYDYVGFDKLVIDSNKIKKTHPNVTLDLSAVAKGYCVDKVVELFSKMGVTKYMIEIGGEVRVGKNQSNSSWNIGILKPEYFSSQSNLLFTLKLNNKSVATSGDYKNYFEKDGQIYSHLFDPRLGKPILNTITSVTVIADDCMLADALATALSVIGVSRGLSIVESYDNVECVFLTRDKNNELKAYTSSGFSQFLLSSEINI